MSTDTKLTDLVVNTLTREQYHNADLTDHGDELFVQSDRAGVFVGANGVNALDEKNVTNCITEIPNDIKLELVGTTLTLKAGSKVYIPNGFEADGVTRKFDIITVASDITYTNTWGTEEQLMIAVDSTGTSLPRTAMSRCTSGTTAPTETNYRWWYDLNTNLIKAYSGGSYSGTNVSFPICIVSVPGDNTAKVTKIDYIFNGFGVVGTTRFMLPGLSGLVADGFNADGSYKNVKFTNPSVYIFDAPTDTKRLFGLFLDSSGNITDYINTKSTNLLVGNGFFRPTTVGDTFEWLFYSTEENKWYRTSGSTTANWQQTWPFLLGIAKGTSTIGFYYSQAVFDALDRNDTTFIAHNAMPGSARDTLTLASSGSSYTAPADGWFYLNKAVGTANTRIEMYNNQTYMRTITATGGLSTSTWCYCIMPARKGDKVQVTYTVTGTTNAFVFIYAHGAH